MVRRFAVVCLLALVIVGSAAAQERSPIALDLTPRLLGADVGIGYRGWALLPGVETTIWAYLGGGYEWFSYYRNASGALLGPGDLAPGGVLFGKDAAFVRIEGAWRLGIAQGFVWNPRTNTNLVEAFLFYRGRADSNQADPTQLLSYSSLPDRTGQIQNVLQAGVGYDDIMLDMKHKTKSGFRAEGSVEWGPSFFLNTLFGDSNYVRLNAKAKAFIPLYDISPETPANLLTVYLGVNASVDYAAGFGSPVPLSVRQTFGGRNQVDALGHAVRGVDSESLDTNFKAVNNIELRANLPALFTPNLVPGVVAYWDVGYFAQVGELGIASPVPSGLVSSLGVGIYIDVFDFGSLAAYLNYRVDGPNADGTQADASLEFGMHF